MKIYHSIDEIPQIKNAVVTQGTFDGVHAAHHVILNRLKRVATEVEGETVVLTFHPHPRLVLQPSDGSLKLLQTIDEKIEALSDAGIDHLIIIPFTKEFSELTSLEFIRDIIIDKIGTKVLVVGYNHRFGKNREGDHDSLSEYSKLFGFQVEEIPQQEVDSVAVSSTKIRNALSNGDLQTANKYLSRPYRISGVVVHGKQLGRTIGFPTANIRITNSDKLIPPDGVYAVRIFIHNKWYGGMLNSGYRPTVDGFNHAIEVHVFEFNNEIYDVEVRIDFVDKLRSEIKFESVHQLKNQLELDKLQALKILTNSF